MNYIQEIVELETKLDSLVLNIGGYACLVMFALLLVAVPFYAKWDKERPNKKNPFSKVMFVFGILMVAAIVYDIFAMFERNEVRDLISEKKNEFYTSLEDIKKIEVNDIIKSVEVADYLCTHVELKENEKCTLIEFVSETEINQVIMPIDDNSYINQKEPLTISYYILTEEERAYANKDLSIDNRSSISPERWSFGHELK